MADKYKKKPRRKETLPDWADQTIKETELSEEEKAFFKKQLDELRNKKMEGRFSFASEDLGSPLSLFPLS